ncbi:peptidase S28 [Pyrrhoderma noxium]|uniref:Peptidase S28 n=1 Tax=Pyrrhoderma noxium TaxID=2282107 RepID=A0A286UPA3_9AGAM|nr:peptidase S28 [Pyrrhoderma noxium]
MLKAVSCLLILAVSTWASRLSNGRSHANMAPVPIVPIIAHDSSKSVTSSNGTELPPLNTTYYFEQLIDHNNPSLGTFKQRFWHTAQYYETGGPIVLLTPGEDNAELYTFFLTNETFNGQIAQQQNGATIVLEHRYYGLSNPFNNLSTASLEFHTIQQAIDDLAYFANNVKLPQPDGGDVTPDKAPWVLVGGSYSGALTGWTLANKPGVFAAGYASSAVSEAIINFWQYYDPIRQFMPQNCSADVQAVVAHIDKTFTSGTTDEINFIKDTFGLGNVTHLDDVAGALRNNLWDWQSLSPTSGPGSQFFDFCDALEVKNGVSAGSDGWGLDHALSAWGAYWKSFYYVEICEDLDAETCLGTYDPTQAYWTDISIDNWVRSWSWSLCNELGFSLVGAPEGTPSITSRLIQPEYYERQCAYLFPEKFITAISPNANATNKEYGGWDIQADNLFFANGKRDPWRDATVSSDFHTRQSTDLQPIALSDGFHCSDLISASGVDPTILAVQQEALSKIKEWLSAWTPPSASEEGKHEPVPTQSQSGSHIVKPLNSWLHFLL